MNNFYNVLTIAGFDGSGGAGIQADLKTFSALGCYGTTALTALPVQNTCGVRAIFEISTECLEEQIKAIFDDIPLHAIKIGMLYREDIIESVASLLHYYKAQNIVLDPVMVAKSGDKLLLPEAILTMKKYLFPLTTILTPNLLEASLLLDQTIQNEAQMEQAGLNLLRMGPEAIVVKGGHLQDQCNDYLCFKSANQNGVTPYWLPSEKIQTPNTHGTGCTFSAAIAAFLAHGFTILEAVQQAKIYVTQAIKAGASLKIGQGHGPLHHFHHLWNFLDTPLKGPHSK